MRTKYSLLALLILLVILGCSVPDETIGTTQSNSGITSVPSETMGTTPSNPPVMSQFSPLSVDLAMEKAPRLNETVTVTCAIKSVGHDAPDTTASIDLPEGAMLVSGNLDWHGDLNSDIPNQFSADIKFVREGKWIISVVANHIVDEEWGWRGYDSIMLTVTRESGKFGWDEQPGSPTKPDLTYQPQPGETPPQPLPDPKGEGVLPPEQ